MTLCCSEHTESSLFKQACNEKVAEAARRYEVVEERDKRLRFLWWKVKSVLLFTASHKSICVCFQDDLRSLKADEANTLRFQMLEAIFKMTLRTSNAVMGMTNEANRCVHNSA
jgi:hypothetical protein